MDMTAARRSSWGLLMSVILALVSSARPGGAEFIEALDFRVERAPERAVVHALQVTVPPTIDGALDEQWWEDALVSPAFLVGGQPATHPTSLRAAFDDQNLYLAAVCTAPDPKRDVPADVHDGNVWGDDCIDLKLSPNGGATSMQFLVNANGARWDLRDGDDRWNPEWTCAAVLNDDGYVIQLALPLAEIGVAELQPGMSLLFTCGRADRTNRQLSTAFGETYGDVMKAAELVLGTAEERAARASAVSMTRDAQLAVYLDRDQYPSFQRLATGRIRTTSPSSGPELQGAPTIEIALLRDGREVEARTVTPVESPVLDFDFRVADIEPGACEIEVRLRDDGGVFASARQDFIIEQATAERSGRIPLTVTLAPAGFGGWGMTFGVPFPWGALDSADHVRLLDEAGREVAMQATVAGRWSKQGSIRWLLVDCVAPVGGEAGSYTLEYGPEVTRAAVPSPLLTEQTDEEITVGTGPLRLVIPRSEPTGIGEVWLDRDGDGEFADAERVLDPSAAIGPYLTDAEGTQYLGSRDAQAEVVLEEAGPLKACVRLSGWHVAESGERLGKFIVRLYAYRGLPQLRAMHTFIITADSDEAQYRDIAWSLPFGCLDYVLGTPNVSVGRVPEQGAYLRQRDDLCYKLYHDGAFKEEGEKSEGWVTVGSPGRWMTLAVRDFWQQFPKELEVTRDTLTVHFWPEHGEDPVRTGDNLSIRNAYHQWFAHEGEELDFRVPEEFLQFVKEDSERYNWPSAKVANAIGLAKSHEMLLNFHTRDWESARSRDVSRVFQDDPTAVVDPAWMCASGAFGSMHPQDREQFPEVETAIDETLDNIARLRAMDRDYGMFNWGDSHHNWDWAPRRWNMHRIWRNTHHGWTRWPWLMYARSGEKALLDWADANARHVADVDHCHYATEDLAKQTYPLQKLVGGICDYKGFVHWASGGRLHYNSIADSMIWHYYITGNRRSLTAALEHGAALIADGKPLAHREGAGRATSSAALYFLTWDNDYLEFLERTVDTLLNTQEEDGRFPQWENFSPYLQRYVDLTGSRRAKQAMTRWGDWICAQPPRAEGYHAKTNILAHAYLYTGDEKYLRAAAYDVEAAVDFIYRGPDPRYYGQFIRLRSNLDQSYFMQEVPYYLTALERLGHEPEPVHPTRTSIRTLSRETIDGEERYVFDARLRQTTDGPLALSVAVRGYEDASYEATLTPVGGGESATATGAPGHDERAVTLELALPADGALEYALRVFCPKNFFVNVPITDGDATLQEVYPIFADGTCVGDGFRWFFGVPDGAERFTLRYKGRSWPLQFDVQNPAGQVVSSDVWIGSNDLTERSQTVAVGDARREGWTFVVYGYGQACLLGLDASPAPADQLFYFAASAPKLFAPR